MMRDREGISCSLFRKGAFLEQGTTAFDHGETLTANRTLMHVDAEARMNTYEDDEGKKHSSLNLVQSKATMKSHSPTSVLI